MQHLPIFGVSPYCPNLPILNGIQNQKNADVERLTMKYGQKAARIIQANIAAQYNNMSNVPVRYAGIDLMSRALGTLQTATIVYRATHGLPHDAPVSTDEIESAFINQSRSSKWFM